MDGRAVASLDETDEAVVKVVSKALKRVGRPYLVYSHILLHPDYSIPMLL
jgi:hypothetical protein